MSLIRSAKKAGLTLAEAIQRFRKEFGRSPTQEERSDVLERAVGRASREDLPIIYINDDGSLKDVSRATARERNNLWKGLCELHERDSFRKQTCYPANKKWLKPWMEEMKRTRGNMRGFQILCNRAHEPPPEGLEQMVKDYDQWIGGVPVSGPDSGPDAGTTSQDQAADAEVRRLTSQEVVSLLVAITPEPVDSDSTTEEESLETGDGQENQDPLDWTLRQGTRVLRTPVGTRPEEQDRRLPQGPGGKPGQQETQCQEIEDLRQALLSMEQTRKELEEAAAAQRRRAEEAEQAQRELELARAAQRRRAEDAEKIRNELEVAHMVQQKRAEEEKTRLVERQKALERMYQEERQRAEEESSRAIREERLRKEDEAVYRRELEEQERRYQIHNEELARLPPSGGTSSGDSGLVRTDPIHPLDDPRAFARSKEMEELVKRYDPRSGGSGRPPSPPRRNAVFSGSRTGDRRNEGPISRDEVELLIRRIQMERNEVPATRPQELPRHRYHQVEIEKFTGDIEKYPAFRQTITYVVSRERFEDERDKAMLLLRHLAGEVRTQVDYLSRNLTNETFTVILGYLDRTYGDSEVIDLRAIRSLDRLPRLVPFNREAMIRLESMINAAKAALTRKTPGALEDPYNEKFQRIYQALAEADQRSFTNFCQNRGGKTHLQNLLDYIGVHVEADKILALTRKRPEKTSDRPSRGERTDDPRPRRRDLDRRRIDRPVYAADDDSGTDSGEESEDYQPLLSTAEPRGKTTGANPRPGPPAENTGARPDCLCCKDQHHLHYCKKFADKSLEERQVFVNEHRLCSGCLRKGHYVRNCEIRDRCGVDGCRRKHHRLLHDAKLFPLLAMYEGDGEGLSEEELYPPPERR